jgi:heme/copper-type cytochrome/quinol oxidase subunit 1
MSIGRTLNRGQRVVLVVALGAGLDVACSWLTASDRLTGWTGYAPLSTSSTFAGPFPTMPAWAQIVIWLALIAVWGAVSLWLLRSAVSRAKGGGTAPRESG